MDECREDADYAVFDDIIGDFEFFRNYKAWLGGQYEFTLSDKYRGKRKFTWGKPVIMCMNNDPRMCSHVDLEWLEGNCNIVYINEPLIEIQPSLRPE